MSVEVVAYRAEWPIEFTRVERSLRAALDGVPVLSIEHVGSTSVPGLAAKPILDIDVIVERQHVESAIAALEAVGYLHRGDLGVTDREAFTAPDSEPARHVYVCVNGTLHLRNHLAVRDLLRTDAALRERYAAVKSALADNPDIDIDAYIAQKSAVLQDVLSASDLTADEKARIFELNTAR